MTRETPIRLDRRPQVACGWILHNECNPAQRPLKGDAKLAARCVAGEVAAWEEIHAQCRESPKDEIRRMLGGGSCDATPVDEIVTRVWCALVAKDGERLARYSPKRDVRLITYLRAMARDELSRHFRAEIRRRRNPQSTPAERDSCREVIFSDEPDEEQEERSRANIWQLPRRICKRLMRFLGR